MRRLLSVSILLSLLPIIAACDSKQSEAPGEGIEIEFTTPSGMHVRMLPNPGSGLFASNIFVGAGSTRETDETAGSSHFLEHLLFNGTERRTQEELYAATDRIGAYSNATTRREYTHYMMVAPREEIAAGLDIQADMLLQSILPVDKFEKERGIVLEEMTKDADDPAQRRQRAVLEAHHGASDFGRPVLGTRESIAGLERDKVLEYYHSQYVPSNMRLVLMGEFDVDEARALVEELFEGSPGTSRPAPTFVPASETIVHRRRVDEEALTISVQIAAPDITDEDFAAMCLLVDVLGGGESSLLRRAMDREPRLEVLDIGASLTHLQGSGLVEIQGRFVPTTDPSMALQRILGEVATLGRVGLRASEWSTARTRALSSAVRQVEQLHYYALMQGDRIWHSPSGFEPRFQRALEHSYPRIRGAAERWFSDPELSIAIAGPDQTDSDEPSSPVALGYAARPEAEAGSDLPGGGILEDTTERVAGVQPASMTRLSNGMTLIHAASPNTRMFAMHLMVLDRSAREPAGREGIADLLHRCMSEGAGHYDRDEFAALLDGIGAEWKLTDSAFIPYDDYYATDPRYSFVRLDCVDIYWKEAVRLLSLMVSDPLLEDTAIEQARQEMLQRVRQDAPRASNRTADRLEILLRGESHPLTHPVFGTEESLAAIDSKSLKGFALDYLDPSNLVLAVVGNIDRAVVVELLEASIRGADVETSRPDVGIAALTEHDQREEIQIGGRQSYLRMARVIEVDPRDRWALEVAVMILSGRMQQDLRETRGWAYSLGMALEDESTVEAGRVVVRAAMGTQSENLDAAEPLVRGYLTPGALETTGEEIATVVNRTLGRARMRRVTSMGRAYNLSYDQVFHGDLGWDDARSAGLRAVTSADVRRASELYLGTGPVIVVVGR